jgi:hypothetical protein
MVQESIEQVVALRGDSMENSSQDQAFKVVIMGQRDHVGIQVIASKKACLNFINGLLPLTYAALLAASFFSSPNIGSQGPPAPPATAYPKIDIPSVRQRELV